MKRAIPILLCAAVALIAPQAAAAATQSATSGDVTATFTYFGSYPQFHGETFAISRAGQVVYSHPVTSPHCGAAPYECAPGALSGGDSVHVLNLDGTGEPNVVLDLFTGGAHCCTLEQVFTFNASTNTYTKAERDFGDAGAQLVDLRHDGVHEFLSADDRFAYAFTDFAASGLPIQILRFSNGRFIDITRHFPKLVAADATSWMKAFRSEAKSHYPDSTGLVAAWAADEDLLGHYKLVSRFLARQARLGHLNSPIEPGGERFVRALQKMLRAGGYVR
jgi:hypothetical protein